MNDNSDFDPMGMLAYLVLITLAVIARVAFWTGATLLVASIAFIFLGITL